MIPERRREWAVFAAERSQQWALRRQFSGLFLANQHRLRELDPTQPIVAACNHTNWWDGFVILLLARVFPERTFYLAQEERHLHRYRFFTRLGAFGLDPAAPRAGLREALRLLRQPQNVVWMFAQGKLLPSWQPIIIRRGANLLARQSHAQILPVTLRYEWLEGSRATIIANFGLPLAARCGTENLEAALQDNFHELDALIFQQDISSFRPLVPPKRSINQVWDKVRGVKPD